MLKRDVIEQGNKLNTNKKEQDNLNDLKEKLDNLKLTERR